MPRGLFRRLLDDLGARVARVALGVFFREVPLRDARAALRRQVRDVVNLRP